MRVVIIRHAEVDFCWSRRCTSEGFDSECSGYDSAPIKEISFQIPKIEYQRLFISELSRSLSTAGQLFPEKEYIESGLVNEVPLRSAFDTKKKFPLWFWNVNGRLQWFMNNRRQTEGRDQTRERARQFVTMMSNSNTDCAVITHGFFMHTLLSEMKKAGFRTDRSSVGYKNGEYVIAEK